MLPSPLAQVNVLVVDDEALVRTTLLRMLRKHGYQCLEAENVNDALRILDQEPVDLVLSDIQMPGKTGVDLVRALADRVPDTSIVMVTSVDDSSVAMECIGLGAYGYVLKPIQTNSILVAVGSALRRRMLEIEHRDREGLLARKVRDQTFEIRASREEIAWRLLAASEHRDNETGSHIRRIGLYAGEIARLVGWDTERVECIQAAAPMHDIGKIGIPDRILQKPGSLTEEEWSIMRTHPATGAAILQGSRVPFIRMGARIAISHHERWDGSGYPAGLEAHRIPLDARITCLVDVYDAISNKRCYHEAWPEEKVVAHIKNQREKLFDPALVDLFFENYDTFRNILHCNPDKPIEPFQDESDRIFGR